MVNLFVQWLGQMNQLKNTGSTPVQVSNRLPTNKLKQITNLKQTKTMVTRIFIYGVLVSIEDAKDFDFQ